jgi:hypothetical protein
MKKLSSLQIDILTVLFIKLTLIFVLWWFCFSHPIDKQLNSEKIAQHLFNPVSKNL